MLTCKHGSPVEPLDSTLLRLDELDTAINATAELLTQADAVAISHELNAVVRTLKRDSYRKSTLGPAILTTTTPTQGDLLV